MSLDTTAGKLADLRERLAKAQDPGSESARARRDAAGRTTPRQRIARLLDPGSFVEIGALGRTPDDPDKCTGRSHPFPAPDPAGFLPGTDRGTGRQRSRPIGDRRDL